jgi:hypothetical protein
MPLLAMYAGRWFGAMTIKSVGADSLTRRGTCGYR